MRKSSKRTQEEAVESASAQDASPPKKTKARKGPKELAPVIEARLPRNAKTKAAQAAANNNNNIIEAAIEPAKKSRAKGKPALQKSSSTDDMSLKLPAGLKKSKSAEDVMNPKGRGPPAKRTKVAAKKPAPKKAGTESKGKLRGKAKKDEENDDAEDEPTPPVAKKMSGRAAPKRAVTSETKEEEVPKKRGAAKKAETEVASETTKKTTARGRGKAPEGEPLDIVEEAKSKGRKGKAADDNKTQAAPKRLRGKKAAPVADQEDKDAEAEEKDAEDIAETVKPIKGKRPASKRPRNRKAVPIADPEVGEDEPAEGDSEELLEKEDNGSEEAGPTQGKKGKAAAKKPRGKKVAPFPEDDKKDESDAEDDAAPGEIEASEVEPDKDGAEEPAENGKAHSNAEEEDTEDNSETDSQ